VNETGSVLQMIYWIVLATLEKTLFALEPTKRIVPTTSTRITASITAFRDVLTYLIFPKFPGQVRHGEAPYKANC
jgi:hypothetical protein